MKQANPNAKTDLGSSTARLAARLRDWNDAEAWAEFNADYRRPICRRALRAGLDETEAQDVFQETLVAVAKCVLRLVAPAALDALVFRIAGRRVADALRARAAMARVIGEAAKIQAATGLEEVPDPHRTPFETLRDRDWKVVIRTARERFKQRMDSDTNLVFDLYWLQGWPAARVAARMHWSLARVHRAKNKALVCLKREVARLLSEPIG